MAEVQNCSLEVSEFELQSLYYFHLGKGTEPTYPPTQV